MIDEKKLIEDVKKYFAKLKAHNVHELVELFFEDIIGIIDEQPNLSFENKTSDNRNLIYTDDLLKAMDELNHSLQGARYYFAHIENWIRSQPKLDVPDNNVEKMNREFEELEVAYFPDELCTYPEYIGKPYFAIRYKENGNHFVGYGTYSPEVLSRYLRDYFMPLAMPKESKWIPCSERLPKESGKYLVTLKGGAVETDSFCKVDNKWVYFNTQIAWFSRELPEPYKGE